MAFRFKLTSLQVPSINLLLVRPRASAPFHSLKLKNFTVNRNVYLCLCSINGDASGTGLPTAKKFCASSGDSEETDESNQTGESNQGHSSKSNETWKRLKRYGISGVLSYGLLNTIYYLITFLVVWFYVAPAPTKMGYFAASGRFLKIMAMVWAGSQVTKLARAGGALALAPFVDGGLSWFTNKFKFESRGKAFMAIVGMCFGLAVLLFLAVTLLWA